MKKRNLAVLMDCVSEAVRAAGFEVNEKDIHVVATKTLDHGHFSTNVALLLGEKMGKAPQEVAQKIVDAIKNPILSKADVAGPGFINLWLEQKFYTRELQDLSQNSEKYLLDSLMVKKGSTKMVIEYSSPNIAKPLGVHHLLSTIIGDALKRISKAYGHKVFAENYPGDTGTQFGKLMVAIELWGDEKVIEKNPIDELLKLYVRFHEEAEKNSTLEDQARAEYKKWEEGDKEARKLWKRIVEWSFCDIQPLYDRLGVTYDGVHGESFFEESVQKILEEGREKGIFVDGKEGAWIVLPDDPNDPPAIVRKSDGTTLYLTRDLAQMDFFEKEYSPNVMVWVVDVAQSLHFKQRFQVYQKLRNSREPLKNDVMQGNEELLTEPYEAVRRRRSDEVDTAVRVFQRFPKTQFVHVVFGRMDFKDQSMSTRKGNIIRLSELLDEAEERALKLAQEKTEGLSEKEVKELARIMGLGAVKYNILSQNRLQNITFDWDRMLSFEGNSAPYLMYTAARANSILRKGDCTKKEAAAFELELKHPLETQVAIDLMLYPDALARATKEYKPNHIANYLYPLAQHFNALYNELPVLKAERESEKQCRLLLTCAVATILEHGLGLLGIEVPEKM